MRFGSDWPLGPSAVFVYLIRFSCTWNWLVLCAPFVFHFALFSFSSSIVSPCIFLCVRKLLINSWAYMVEVLEFRCILSVLLLLLLLLSLVHLLYLWCIPVNSYRKVYVQYKWAKLSKSEYKSLYDICS